MASLFALETHMKLGTLAAHCGKSLPVRVYQSNAGFYLGTYDDEGPFTRESEEYWRKEADAYEALARGSWIQRTCL